MQGQNFKDFLFIYMRFILFLILILFTQSYSQKNKKYLFIKLV